ncbi:MAG: baseplate J/gp47 family protein [Burkholderiales bacterium]|nr:baseplate J/gp47 family protein [Burkholderiales bacterium]
MPADIPFQKKDFAGLVKDLLEDVRSGSGGRIALTDAAEGSVVRTLMEVFARELAVCYEQLDMIYRSAYLDTATGASLDNVVALLGIQRRRAGHLEGSVTFGRGQPAPEDIHIPAGTLVSGRKAPEFATVEDAVLRKGESAVSVGVRALEPGGETVGPGILSVMPRPIALIDQLHNAGELILRQREETDEELRDRARHLVSTANTGTVSSLEQAARSLGIVDVKVLEDHPGEVRLVLGDADVSMELADQVRARAEEVRPAGVILNTSPATRVWVQVTATLELDVDLPDHQKKAIESELCARLEDYFGKLKVGEMVRAVKVRNLLTSHDAVAAFYAVPGVNFLEPFVWEENQLKAMSTRYLVNQDVIVGSAERVGLYVQALPIRLILEPPKVNVWVDVTLTLKPGQESKPAEEKARAVVKLLLEEVSKPLTGPEDAADLKYDDIQGKLKDLASRLRVTVIHEGDGRVVELDRAGHTDQVGGREQPLLRNVVVKPGDAQ